MSTTIKKSVSVKLDYPIETPDGLISEITIRRPIMKDMIKHNVTENSKIAEFAKFVADLCEMNVEDIELLDMSDWEKLQSEMLRFRGHVA